MFTNRQNYYTDKPFYSKYINTKPNRSGNEERGSTDIQTIPPEILLRL